MNYAVRAPPPPACTCPPAPVTVSIAAHASAPSTGEPNKNTKMRKKLSRSHLQFQVGPEHVEKQMEAGRQSEHRPTPSVCTGGEATGQGWRPLGRPPGGCASLRLQTLLPAWEISTPPLRKAPTGSSLKVRDACLTRTTKDPQIGKPRGLKTEALFSGPLAEVA